MNFNGTQNVICEVTQEMIDQGCHQASNCPVATAIGVHLNPDADVFVNHDRITLVGPSGDTTHVLPPLSVDLWVQAYDYLSFPGVSVHPFQFQLPVPVWALKAA